MKIFILKMNLTNMGIVDDKIEKQARYLPKTMKQISNDDSLFPNNILISFGKRGIIRENFKFL